MVKKDENVFNDNGSYTFGDDRIRFIILESRGKDKSAKRDKKISVPLFLMIRLSYLTVNQGL